MTDQSATRSRAGGLVPDRVREFFWPDDGSDPVTRLLVMAIALVAVALLAVLAYALVVSMGASRAPRTAQERQLLVLEGLTRARPTDASVWTDYARTLITSGQYGLAEEAIKTGLAATKNSPFLLVERGRLYSARGNQAKALKQLDDAVVRLRETREKEYKALAEKTITPGKQANEGVINAMILKAEILEGLMRWEDAAKAYSEALEEDALMSDVLVSRAEAYARLKQFDKARADYESALKMIPDYEPAKKGLAQIEKESGK